MCVSVCSACMYVCAACAPEAQRGQKMALDPPGIVVVNGFEPSHGS